MSYAVKEDRHPIRERSCEAVSSWFVLGSPWKDR
jgi:hypothetical protein